MDHDVAEQASGASDVSRGRRCRVARENRDEFDRADFAGRQAASNCCKARIEAAIEAHHKHRARVPHHVKAGTGACRVEIDRLFAEYGLVGAHGTLDELRVRVGWRAYEDGIAIGRSKYGTWALHSGARRAGDGVGRSGIAA